MFLCTGEESRRRDWPDLQIILQGRLWDTKALQNFRYTQEVSERIIPLARAESLLGRVRLGTTEATFAVFVSL